MCGRFTLHSPKIRIKQQYDAQISFDIAPNYNISPGQNILILTGDSQHQRPFAEMASWGIHPKWAKNKSQLLLNNHRLKSVG